MEKGNRFLNFITANYNKLVGKPIDVVGKGGSGSSVLVDDNVSYEKDATHYNVIYSEYFDGEKNLGEVNPIKYYKPDYYGLRLRSYQSFLESDITQMVTKSFTTWMIGSGLKPQVEPIKEVLNDEGIELDIPEFSKSVESYFKLFSKNKLVDYSKQKTISRLTKASHADTIIGGDTLVVLRYTKKRNVTVQLIDGGNVQSPMFGTDDYPLSLKNGNHVKNGVEVSKKTGEHVAYWVKVSTGKYKRVEARGKRGDLQRAFLVYGSQYRIDDTRGMPLISVVLESLSKLDRYKEATVGSAEERQKIAYTIEHGTSSTGENPLLNNLAKAYDTSNESKEKLPSDVNGKELARTVAATTNKNVFNLPIEASLKQLESKNELHFKDFYDTNIGIICAAMGIPPEVAKSSFNSNYSASRAAIKSWEHALGVGRNDYAEQFNQPVYELFLEVRILEGKINAPGYLEAILTGNIDVLIAYRCVRWIGPKVPHIDPVKEVEAERRKLGSSMGHVPLTTQSQAIESVSDGDASQITETVGKELKEVEDAGISSSTDGGGDSGGEE